VFAVGNHNQHHLVKIQYKLRWPLVDLLGSEEPVGRGSVGFIGNRGYNYKVLCIRSTTEVILTSYVREDDDLRANVAVRRMALVSGVAPFQASEGGGGGTVRYPTCST
ncbi:hypothetical protein [truncated ORF], partial [Aspergillus niger]|uniref:Uncharacterized protein n=3 Tax=Aspergillus niger TaxID=5061 RepID=A0AAJ8BML7_ASPNG